MATGQTSVRRVTLIFRGIGLAILVIGVCMAVLSSSLHLAGIVLAVLGLFDVLVLPIVLGRSRR